MRTHGLRRAVAVGAITAEVAVAALAGRLSGRPRVAVATQGQPRFCPERPVVSPGALAITVAGAGALGFGVLDDLAGSGSRRGLRGHLGALAHGEVTTGAVKLAGLAATGLAGGLLLGGGRTDTIINAGLIAGGAHPSPVSYAPVITTTTHKTLRGPRGAMIMSDAEHAKDVDRAVFPGLQGGPHNHTTAAIAVALHEAAQPDFRTYAHQIVINAQALADALLSRGFDLVSGGTDNHLILMDLTSKGIGGKPAAKALDRAGLETNYNTVPFDQRKPFDPSGLRIGTPAITTRGLREEHMISIAAWMDEAITAATKDDEAVLDRIAAEVRDLLESFPAPGWQP